jgi:uncharacterized integral membrane protein
MKTAGLIIMLIAVTTVFSVQNAPPVSVAVLFWNLEMPLTLVIVIAMLIGMLTGGLIVYRPEVKAKEKGVDLKSEKGE